MVTNGECLYGFYPIHFSIGKMEHISQSEGLSAGAWFININYKHFITFLHSSIHKIPHGKPYFLLYKYAYVHMSQLGFLLL